MLMPGIFGENLFDTFFDDDFMRPARPQRFGTPQSAVMKTDIKENEGDFEIAIDLPGYKKEDVQAELKDGYLTINASTSSTSDEKDQNGRYIRRERFYGNCSRSFYVGKQITEEDIKARFEDGTLKLTVPKKEPKKEIPEKKFIAIEG